MLQPAVRKQLQKWGNRSNPKNVEQTKMKKVLIWIKTVFGIDASSISNQGHENYAKHDTSIDSGLTIEQIVLWNGQILVTKPD